MSYWRARARALIADLMSDLPADATLADRRKALWGKGWPAHGGTQWGRRMWGSEVRKYLNRYDPKFSCKQVYDGFTWPADVHFPFSTAAVSDAEDTRTPAPATERHSHDCT